MKQMVEAFDETHCSILGSEVVEGPAISSYGVLDCTSTPKTRASSLSTTWSKNPSPKTRPPEHAIIGRYILTPRIFDMLEHITPGAGGELQLTDAIKALLQLRKGLWLQLRRQAPRCRRQARLPQSHRRVRPQARRPRPTLPRMAQNSPHLAQEHPKLLRFEKLSLLFAEPVQR